ncbi:hypothetical protein P4S65_16620 [Pseudoalteromonas sp. B131b]|uniref:hypothetical protein n=1 Tax=Pseudoalteromonas sp. B131b TaxID=630493 RepID=UPI00301B7D2B
MKMAEQQSFKPQRTSAPEPFNPHVQDLSVLSEAEFSDLFPVDAACKATESIRPRGTATDIVNGLTKELPNYLLNREQRIALKKFNKKPLNSFLITSRGVIKFLSVTHIWQKYLALAFP